MQQSTSSQHDNDDDGASRDEQDTSVARDALKQHMDDWRKRQVRGRVKDAELNRLVKEREREIKRNRNGSIRKSTKQAQQSSRRASRKAVKVADSATAIVSTLDHLTLTTALPPGQATEVTSRLSRWLAIDAPRQRQLAARATEIATAMLIWHAEMHRRAGVSDETTTLSIAEFRRAWSVGTGTEKTRDQARRMLENLEIIRHDDKSV